MPAAIAIQNKRPVYQKNASIIRASNNPSPLRRVQANGENEGCSRQGIDKKLSSRVQRIGGVGELQRVVGVEIYLFGQRVRAHRRLNINAEQRQNSLQDSRNTD